MILSSERRNDALDVGYRAMLETPSIAPRVVFTKEEFKQGCKDFEVYGFFSDEPAGMTFLDGNKPHIAILKRYHGKCGAVIKQALAIYLKSKKRLEAHVNKDNMKAIKFIERLNFKYYQTVGDNHIYILGDNDV